MNPQAMPTLPSLALRDPIVIGLCGRAGSGKTAAACYLEQEHDFAAFAFAGALKNMLASHLTDRRIDYAHLHDPHLKEAPLPGMAPITARQLMQTFGDAGRAVDVDYWVNCLADHAGLGPNQTPVHSRIVLSDVRHPNEAAFVKRLGGTLVMLVRDGAPAVRAHASEATHLLRPDVTLFNFGPTLEGLHGMLRGLLCDLGIEPRTLPLEAHA